MLYFLFSIFYLTVIVLFARIGVVEGVTYKGYFSHYVYTTKKEGI